MILTRLILLQVAINHLDSKQFHFKILFTADGTLAGIGATSHIHHDYIYIYITFRHNIHNTHIRRKRIDSGIIFFSFIRLYSSLLWKDFVCLPTSGSKFIVALSRWDSDLEAFSHNPSDGSFAPLADRPNT
uniref:Uncharacterized protein n=1 Tax=Onchocerca volvulus TaxID=6282 RepID=A0A8R1XTD5_ONCVO